MKIAWLIGTNSTLSDFVHVDSINNSGGWNNTQLRSLSANKNVSKIVIISVRPEKYAKMIEEDERIKIYHLPYKTITRHVNYKLMEEIANIIEEEKPDIVDIQGAENTYSAITYTKNISCPVVVTLHGIAFQCERFYTRGVPTKSLLFDRTLVDGLFSKGILEKKSLMHARAVIERNVLQSVDYVRGRTSWDRACAFTLNDKVNYYHEELILRDAFAHKKWSLNTCNPYRIFTSQANSPLKSLYTLMETVALLKKKYSEVELIVPGYPLRKGVLKNGYDKTIVKRIKELGIDPNVHFVGNLTADQMSEELVKARVFVLQSEIENSPNSLAEAQMIGTPVVSSFTGGTPEYIDNGKTGFLYNSYDPVMAAMHIDRIFSDEKLCIQISENERMLAKTRHDERTITDNLVNIYQSILKMENDE